MRWDFEDAVTHVPLSMHADAVVLDYVIVHHDAYDVMRTVSYSTLAQCVVVHYNYFSCMFIISSS
jgi:hypothetical protein